jgi:hypothetical protein
VKRTISSRVLSAVMAVIFLLPGAGEELGARPCPHHDLFAFLPTSTGASTNAGSHDAHDAHAAHAPAADAQVGGHHHGHDQSLAQSTSSDGQGDHGSCTCQGSCATSSTGFLPVEPTVAIVARVESTIPVAIRADDLFVPHFIPYFLPYAQAPPLG